MSVSLYDLEKLELGLLNHATELNSANSSYAAIPALGTVQPGTPINREFLLSATKSIIESNYQNMEDAIGLYNTVFNQNAENLLRIEGLKSKVKNLFFKMKNVQAISEKLPSYINQINLDFTNKSLFNEATTALISDKIIGINTGLKRVADYSNFTLTTYTLDNMSVNLIDNMGVTSGYISAPNINIGNAFSIAAESHYFIENRRFELVINRPNKEEINQVDLSLNESYIVKLQSSTDNIVYRDLSTDVIYVKDAILPIEPNTDPYLKITFYKNSNIKSVTRNGNYFYKLDINHLYLTGISINDQSQFITNNIDLSASNISGISLDICDNYQDKNVDISYFIDFNEENNWKEIRPIGKLKDTKTSVSSYLKLNDYYTNKIVSVNPGTAIAGGDGLLYQLVIEPDFIQSNQIRVFNKLISVDTAGWKLINGQYACTGILNTAKTLKLSNTYPLYIDGKAYIGDSINLDAGVYDLAIDANAYLYTFDRSVYTVTSISNTGLFTLTSKKDGTVITIQDTQYPYNLKYNVEDIFDFLLYEELIENEQYTLYNEGTSYSITTKIPYNNLYIAYRLFASDGTGVMARIKGTYQSLNNITIPYTDRITIRYV